MATRESKTVLYAAIFANVAIAICKFVAAALTHSSDMLADTGNELLLLWGMKRSARPPDALHPYGHGKVLYFYSLLVAVYIFGVGGGLAVHEGIAHLKHPQIPTHPAWNYAVLALSAAFDFYSWRISYRELRSRKDPDESIWDEIIGGKDPTVFTVFLEDSAGLLGVVLAFLAIFLGRQFNNAYLDPLASIAIGSVLAVIAIFLGRESGALLVGERTSRARIKRLRDIITADPAVDKVGDLLTMQLGPDQVLLNVDIQFRGKLNLQELELAIDRIEARIRQEQPSVQRIFIEAESFKTADKSSGKAA